MQEFKTAYISTATTTHIGLVGRNVKIHSICIPKATSGTVTFQDMTGTPVTYFVLPAASVGACHILDSIFGNGLDVVTSAADTVLVNYIQY